MHQAPPDTVHPAEPSHFIIKDSTFQVSEFELFFTTQGIVGDEINQSIEVYGGGASPSTPCYASLKDSSKQVSMQASFKF